MPVLAGTSGWQYRDWRDVLYPAGVPQRAWLEHYAGCYPTVENNGAFYRLPAPQTFEAWRHRTPPGFVMAVKASRYLTHIRRLRDAAGPVERLLTAASRLGDRLGPVLLQLPPNLRADHEALEECLGSFARFAVTAGGGLVPAGSPGGRPVRVVVEFRHESWWTGRTQEVLAAHQAALCWADRRGRPAAPLWRTAGWGYLRLHEGAASPWPRYGPRALASWADRLAQAWPAGADVFAYFNNDQHGAAVRDARAFAAITGRNGTSRAARSSPDSGCG